jgi:hypothetical protein
LTTKQRVEVPGRVVLHGSGDVRVQVKRDANVGVPEHLADDLGVHPAAEQQRGQRMPQVVEADTRQPGGLK